MRWARARPGEATVLVVAALSVFVGAGVGLVGTLSNNSDLADGAGVVALLVAHLLVLTVSVATIGRTLRRRRTAAPQLVLAMAGATWAGSALGTDLDLGVGWDAPSTVVITANLSALALLALAVAVVPSGTGLLRVATRVVLDAAALGLGTACAVASLATPALGDAADPTKFWIPLSVALVLFYVAALGLVRRPSRQLHLPLTGVVIACLGTVWLLLAYAAVMPTAGWWAAGVVILAGCGLASAGQIRIGHPRARIPAQDPSRALRGERRDLVVHSVVTALAIGLISAGGVKSAASGIDPPPVAMILGLGTGGVLAVREVLVMLVRRRLVRRVMANSRTDALTGLVNRMGLADHLDGRGLSHGVLVVIDIDGFARINEVLGQSGADRLLVGVADGMRSVPLPKGSTLARTGGDEFAAWLPGPGIPRALATELVRAATAGKTGRGHGAFTLTASAGIAPTGPVGGAEHHDGHAHEAALSDVLLHRASAALVSAKRSGPASVAVFDADLADAQRRRLLVERRLSDVLRDGARGANPGLGLHYQPLVDLASGRVVGVEALARWQDSVLGSVSPGEFIPVAEQTGLIEPFGRRMLDIAAAAMGGHQSAAGPGLARPDLSVAVNVSAAQLHSRHEGRGFAEAVSKVLDSFGVDPARLVIEVTESMLISRDDPAVAELRRLIDNGISVAIDDFGSGYWALGYLQWLPAQILKVDQELVKQLGSDPRSDKVVAGIVALAQDLGMDVVVEGVENAEIAARARELGPVLAQGWHFAAAVPLVEVPAMIASVERAWPATVHAPGPTHQDTAALLPAPRSPAAAGTKARPRA